MKTTTNYSICITAVVQGPLVTAKSSLSPEDEESRLDELGQDEVIKESSEWINFETGEEDEEEIILDGEFNGLRIVEFLLLFFNIG